MMWTPQGYYAGSPGADNIVGWQINRGPDKDADYVTAEQLRKHLNRRDIVAKAIQFASTEEAARASSSHRLARGGETASGSIAIKIALDATPGPVTRVRIQVNGREFDAARLTSSKLRH